jgi:hypothetical protein
VEWAAAAARRAMALEDPADLRVEAADAERRAG